MLLLSTGKIFSIGFVEPTCTAMRNLITSRSRLDWDSREPDQVSGSSLTWRSGTGATEVFFYGYGRCLIRGSIAAHYHSAVTSRPLGAIESGSWPYGHGMWTCTETTKLW